MSVRAHGAAADLRAQISCVCVGGRRDVLLAGTTDGRILKLTDNGGVFEVLVSRSVGTGVVESIQSCSNSGWFAYRETVRLTPTA